MFTVQSKKVIVLVKKSVCSICRFYGARSRFGFPLKQESSKAGFLSVASDFYLTARSGSFVLHYSLTKLTACLHRRRFCWILQSSVSHSVRLDGYLSVSISPHGRITAHISPALKSRKRNPTHSFTFSSFMHSWSEFALVSERCLNPSCVNWYELYFLSA